MFCGRNSIAALKNSTTKKRYGSWPSRVSGCVGVCDWLSFSLSLSLSFFLRNSPILKLRVQLFFSLSLSLAVLAQFADPANCDLNCLIQECCTTTCTMEHSNITTYYRDHFFSQFGLWGLLILLRGGCCCSKTFQKNETVLFCLLYRFPTLLPHPLIKSKSISLASVLPSLLTFFFSFLQTFNEKRTRQSNQTEMATCSYYDVEITTKQGVKHVQALVGGY